MNFLFPLPIIHCFLSLRGKLVVNPSWLMGTVERLLSVTLSIMIYQLFLLHLLLGCLSHPLPQPQFEMRMSVTLVRGSVTPVHGNYTPPRRTLLYSCLMFRVFGAQEAVRRYQEKQQGWQRERDARNCKWGSLIKRYIQKNIKKTQTMRVLVWFNGEWIQFEMQQLSVISLICCQEFSVCFYLRVWQLSFSSQCWVGEKGEVRCVKRVILQLSVLVV